MRQRSKTRRELGEKQRCRVWRRMPADAPTSPVGRLGSGFQTTPGALQQTPANPASGPDAFVVRLKPQGAIDYATYLGGSSQAWSDGIAVDALGAAFIIGAANSAKFPVTPGAYLAASGIPNFSASSFLARLSPDGSALIDSTFTDAQADHDAAVAVDSADNAVVLLSNAAGTGSGVLRFNPQGTVRLFSKSLPASDPAGLALDAAGNAYLASFTGANYPVKNSLAACDSNGSSALTVLDGNGNVLQSTYIPGSSGYTNTTPRSLARETNSLWSLASISGANFTVPDMIRPPILLIVPLRSAEVKYNLDLYRLARFPENCSTN